MVETLETEAALARSLKGLPVLGVESILAKDPLHRPPPKEPGSLLAPF
jgi:hypothetical protein